MSEALSKKQEPFFWARLAEEKYLLNRTIDKFVRPGHRVWPNGHGKGVKLGELYPVGIIVKPGDEELGRPPVLKEDFSISVRVIGTKTLKINEMTPHDFLGLLPIIKNHEDLIIYLELVYNKQYKLTSTVTLISFQYV